MAEKGGDAHESTLKCLEKTVVGVMIIRFCNAMAGAPFNIAHAGRSALAVPDLCSPHGRISSYL